MAVIGAGVTGCAIARELSRYDLKVTVIEKCEDVCSGTSKANSGIVHAGYDAVPGTNKARFNVEGSRMIHELYKTLDFPFKENGSMVVCFDKEDEGKLKDLYERGLENKVEDLRIITGDEAREIEPNLSDKITAALLVPRGGIVDPFLMTVAFAENAAVNGTDFKFLTEVKKIEKLDKGFKLSVLKLEKENGAIKKVEDSLECSYVVNAAGVYADEIHNMLSEKKLHITPRRGQYVLLDKEAKDLVTHTIFQLPTNKGKGVLVTPTAHGNMMVGPDAEALLDKEETETTGDGMSAIKKRALDSVADIPYQKTITSFAGLRASEDGHDFVLGEAEDVEGFFDAAGIESPGLSSAPAIGKYIAELVGTKAGAEKKTDFIEERKGITHVMDLSSEEKSKLIKERPEYGHIICRCEEVTEGEIIDAIRRPVGARSLDGVKRRVRQGMGRCQAGFCTPLTVSIIARELGIDEEDVCKNMPGSEILVRD